MGSTRTSILEILRNANSSVSVLRSSRAAHYRKTSQIGTPRHSHSAGAPFARAGQIFKREADGCAPSAQHAAGNLDNRHVEIVCAASARVNVSVFYQPLTPPISIGLLTSPAAGFSRSGKRVARSFPERWPAVLLRGLVSAVQGHQLAL